MKNVSYKEYVFTWTGKKGKKKVFNVPAIHFDDGRGERYRVGYGISWWGSQWTGSTFRTGINILVMDGINIPDRNSICEEFLV